MEIRSYTYSFPYRPSYGYLILLVMLLVMSWESLKADAAIVGGEIPEESIRLRILAHSDSAADQALKRHVRDAIVAEMERYTLSLSSIEEARDVMQAKLPAIEELVRTELALRGFDYDVKVELGQVAFPTKMYGSRVYPAGDYEALRVTIGAGLGENWWCVLFPPLCFVDAVSGEATAVSAAAGETAGGNAAAASGQAEAPEVKFFLWELLKGIGEFFKNLFS